MEDGRSQVLLAKVYSKMERTDDAVTSLQQVNAFVYQCGSGVGGEHRRKYAEVSAEGNMPHIRGKQSLLTHHS